MAANERVQWNINDLPLGQLAPSQSGRTQAFPGNKNIIQDEVEWKEFRAPTGNPAIDVSGPAALTRVRVIKLDRNVVCDDTIPAPTVTGTVVDAIASTFINGTHTLTETTTQPDPAGVEKRTGYDWAEE